MIARKGKVKGFIKEGHKLREENDRDTRVHIICF